MKEQKEAILEHVKSQCAKGRRIRSVLSEMGIARASYYRWRQKALGNRAGTRRKNTRCLTPQEQQHIERIKAKNPGYRHRRIQGELMKDGYYLSMTSIYEYLRVRGLVEPFSRRPSPLKEAKYEVCRRNRVWGCDWTKLLIGGTRWYLITLLDFFSRLWVSMRIVPTVCAADIKGLYAEGLLAQGISRKSEQKPALRVDRGSPNTSLITREFFNLIGADLSFARVRRPTDNALTERHYGTIKQEEIYLVGNYPDVRSAWEELGKYRKHYNNERPHQGLWNFTPGFIHELDNKSKALEILQQMKHQTMEKRKQYWQNQNNCELEKISILSH